MTETIKILIVASMIFAGVTTAIVAGIYLWYIKFYRQRDPQNKFQKAKTKFLKRVDKELSEEELKEKFHSDAAKTNNIEGLEVVIEKYKEYISGYISKEDVLEGK